MERDYESRSAGEIKYLETILIMKLVGFIKEHNSIKEAKEYSVIRGSHSTNQEIVANTIAYLNNGMLLLAWMGYFIDLEDGNLISPDSYYTDGIYIWPAYFPYYLKKYPCYPVDDDFLTHLLKNNFQMDLIENNTNTKDRLEGELLEKLNGPC